MIDNKNKFEKTNNKLHKAGLSFLCVALACFLSAGVVDACKPYEGSEPDKKTEKNTDADNIRKAGTLFFGSGLGALAVLALREIKKGK